MAQATHRVSKVKISVISVISVRQKIISVKYEEAACDRAGGEGDSSRAHGIPDGD